VSGRSTSAGHLAIGLAFAIIGVVCFSLRPVLIKLAYAYVVDPVTLLALRMIFSVPFFVAAALWTRNAGNRLPPISRRDMAAVVVLGLLSYYLASFLDFLGLQYISAGLGRLLQFVYPTVVVILSALFLAKRPTPRDVAALALTYFGLVLVFWHALGGEHLNLWLGAALVFISATCYATYLVAGAEVIARVGSVRFTAYAMIVASAACVLQFFLLRPVSALDLPLPVYGYSVAMAIFSTVIPGFLIAEALRRIGANHVAIIGALGPVTAILLGYLGLDEIMTPLQVIGAAFVLVGVVVVSVKRKTQKA
jgi:drug/metabolite transporter (DMT)-like permease